MSLHKKLVFRNWISTFYLATFFLFIETFDKNPTFKPSLSRISTSHFDNVIFIERYFICRLSDPIIDSSNYIIRRALIVRREVILHASMPSMPMGGYTHQSHQLQLWLFQSHLLYKMLEPNPPRPCLYSLLVLSLRSHLMKPVPAWNVNKKQNGYIQMDHLNLTITQPESSIKRER